jgi:PEGA domain
MSNFFSTVGFKELKGGQAMKRVMKPLFIALVALLTLAPLASTASAQRGGHVFVAAGPRFYGGWGGWGPGWGWYGPGWYAGYWGPGYYGRPAGTVKIETKVKGEAIYVDGGYAGVTGHLKKFPLRPGTHDIAVNDPNGHPIFNQRVQVLLGQTTKIYPNAPQS